MSGILQGSLLQGVRDLCDRSFAARTVLLLPMRGGNGHTGFIDASPVPNTMTVNGNAAMSTAQYKWYGSSGYFDGNGDFLSIPGTLPTALQLGSGDFTIEFYVYTTSTATQFICGNLNDNFGTGHYWVIINSTVSGLHTVQFGTQGSFFKFGTTTLTTNTWQHIAVTRSGNSLRCFLNGAQLGTTQTLGNFTGTVTNEFRIASAIPGASNSYFLTGYLQDFRITKGTVRYTTNFAPPGAALPDTDCECDANFSLVSVHLPMTGTNGSTAFTDYSPSTKTVTVNGGAQISTAQSKWNTGSGYFDGSGDYISVPGSSALQFGTGDFTIEGWIKSTTTGSMNGPFGQFPAGAVAGKWDIKTRFSGANNFIFTYYTGSAYVDTAASPAVNLNDDVWHHIAVVRSDTNIYMFSDGVLRRSTTISSGQSIGVSSHTFNVGYNPEDNAYYTGYVNDVRITKGLARYTSAFTPPTVALPLSKCRQSDPFYNVVSLHLPMTGVNTATALTDFSPNPKPITAVGNTTRSTTQYKWNGSSLYFDGNGDYLSVPANTAWAFGTGDFTVEFWAYQTNTDVWRISNRPEWTGQSGVWGVNASPTAFGLSEIVTGEPGVYAGGLSSVQNQWAHYAVTRSSGLVYLFRNGVLLTSAVFATDFNVSSNSLKIGTQAGSIGLQGYINDVRITNGVARYTASFTAPTVPLPTAGIPI